MATFTKTTFAVFYDFELFWGVLGIRGGPNGSGQLIGFIWAKFEAKRLILDPFWTKFDVFGSDRTLAGT